MFCIELLLAVTFVLPKDNGRLTGFAFGNGHYLRDPGAFSIPANGHNNATSYNGFEFANGKAFVVGSEAPITRVWHDPTTGEVGLENDEGKPFRVVEGGDVFAAAFEYRRRYPRTGASGVAAKAGKFCVDVWNGTYREQAEFVRRAATELGVSNDVFLCTHVWQRYGYDNHLPDVYPPDPAFGTAEDLKELAATCRRHGWGFGVHHNVVDFYTNSNVFAWKDIARTAKGEPVRAWRNVFRGVQSYRMMPEVAPAYMRRSLDEMNADGFSPDMLFVDVIGSFPARPYWRPDGAYVPPAEARRHIGEVFDTIRRVQTAACGRPAFTASEAAHDYLTGHLDGGDCQWMEVTRQDGEYCWNVIPEYADAEKIPWFDAVNHTSFVLHGAGYSIRYEAGRGELEHGIDSDDYLSAEVLSGHALMTDCYSRDVKDVLSGTVRPLDMDRCLGQLRRKWTVAQPVARELAAAEMTGHAFVGGDIHRQRIDWSSGMTVYVNRGEGDWRVAGATLPRYGWLAVNPRTGLRCEVSRERPRARVLPTRYLDVTPEEIVRNPGRYELHFWLARRKPTENSHDYYDRLLKTPDEVPADAPRGVPLDRLVTVTDRGADPHDVSRRYYLKGTPSFFRRFYLKEREVIPEPRATVALGEIELPTYPFSDPDPVPATSERRWPYFRYDGSSATSAPRKWRTVVLENGRIRVTLTPEVGGKVWGATDKRTGRDFIYFNHAAKFRNIALRGPWASGGIEFNFGLIGHAPSTVTPVDWCVRTNADGSVSYFCSNTELINRTTWQVEVRLGKDDPFFTTRSRWHNGSNLPCPYYHWMNAAYSTQGDPELVFPGTFQVGHEGDAHPWPLDERGRDVHFVNRTGFGANKSYHVCGGDTRLFGVWWKDWNFGSYHRNELGEKYGRKAWIWALSREGAIWEDLLTDADGQYMELQSGRGFNQPRKRTFATPFKHPTFAPGGTDEFAEEWGVWHDRREFAGAWDRTNGVDRAETMPADFDWTTAYGLYLRGEQALREKDDATADEFLRKALAKEPCFAPALVALAELCYRRANAREAGELSGKALRINAYDPAANYWSGMLAKDRGETLKAVERLGLAAYSPFWRAGAEAEIAKAWLAAGDCARALAAATKCREACAKSVDGYALSVLALRGLGESAAADRLLAEALDVWPLSRVLLSLTDNPPATANELPGEVETEVATWYLGCGQTAAARRHFRKADNLMGDLMAAWTDRDEAALGKVAARDVRFVFAFRRECVPALDWALTRHDSWKFRYLRAQFASANGDRALADRLLAGARDADDAAFYIYRGTDGDLLRAAQLEDSWRVGRARMKALAAAGRWAEAKAVGADYLKRFPGCDPIEILYARTLVELKEYRECLSFLEGVSILPSEFGDSATDAWHAAQDALGIRRTWPEKLGKGKPADDGDGCYENDRVTAKVTGVAFSCGANTDPDYVQPDLYATFRKADGTEKEYWFHGVSHKGSFVVDLLLTPEMRRELGAGATFTGIRMKGGRPETNAKIRIEDAKAFKEELKPLDVRVTPRDRLPFPTRRDTIVPRTDDPAEGDLRADWNVKLPEGCAVTRRRIGKSLVIDVTAPAGAVTEVPLGTACEAKKVKSFPIPYLTWGERRGRVLADLLEGGWFRLAEFDWYVSNASDVIARETPGGRELVARYRPDTAGNLKPVRERIVITLSRDFDEILPEIPNPRSPWKHVCGRGVWRSHPSYDRADDLALWRAARQAGFRHLVVTDHETQWRDNGEPFTFCTVAAAGKGGDAAQLAYAKAMTGELGYRYGPYNNFTDLSTQCDFFSRDAVARRPDGSFYRAWMRCYGPKPVLMPAACDRFAAELRRKFGFNTAYCDVHTSMLPWQRTDYDARVPGAATYAQTFYSWGETLLKQKRHWDGPVYSEGSHQFMWAGLADGSYAQDRSYDFRKEPWLVDFELFRTQRLATDFGMGSLGMFSPPKTNLERMYYQPGAPRGRNEVVDRFLAATIAFGHSGFLICDNCWDPASPFGPAYGRPTKPVWRERGFPAEMYRSYFMVQALAAAYTESEAESVRYAGADGRLRTTSEALADGSIALNRIVTRYRNGVVTVVNGSDSTGWETTVDGRKLSLAPNGFAGWGDGVEVLSTDVDGRRVHASEGPEYRYREVEGDKPEVCIKAGS